MWHSSAIHRAHTYIHVSISARLHYSTNMSSSSDAVPLIPQAANINLSYNERMISQTLGGRTYRIDPSLVEQRAQQSLWKKALKASVALLLSPVLVPTAALYTASMYLGPRWWRHEMTSLMIQAVTGKVAHLFDQHRHQLLHSIQPHHAVLDLGAGAGHYLKYLKTAHRILALEPVHFLHAAYRKQAHTAGVSEEQLELSELLLEEYIETHPDQKASFDWVIWGNVLCEVKDQHSTLRCVDQLLKPGGHVYFSEHVGSPQGSWKRCLQDWINPVWRTAAGGCNCNRDTLVNRRTVVPSWKVISWEYSGFQVGLGPFVLGLALKP